MKNLYKNLKLLSIILLGWNVGAFAQSGGVTTFNYTGSVQTYTVPRGITKITVNAMGAEGGLNSLEGTFPDRPGYGACVFDTITVTVGQVLNIYVGGQGATGTTTGTIAGGYNGGGNGANNVNSLGGAAPTPYGGGGGGGASDIRISPYGTANRVVVAGGGGGAGLHCANTTTPNIDRGGDGGTTTGETGAACSGTTGGTGGTPTAPGTGGDCSTCAGLVGSAGSGATGGGAGVCCGLGLGSAGGGGGGGFYGGGGGDWTGGGGGSSYGSAHATMARGCNSNGNGVVVVSPVCMTPGITGNLQVCAGLKDTLYDDTTGGVWSSSDGGSIITIGSTNGIITGVSAGTTVVTYVVGPCYTTVVFTVNPLPAATTGADSVCVGSTTTLSSTSVPGLWSSSITSVATVGTTSGIVSGIHYGTTIITYTLGTGCINTTIVTVDSLPSPITGRDTVCAGLTTTYQDVTSTGVGLWSSSNTLVASIGSLTGIISGNTAGTAIITYTVPTGACMVMDEVTVHPLPNVITGADTVCVASTTFLTDTAAGGTWSNNLGTTIVNVNSTSGAVTGVLAGSAIITYTLPTGCIMTDTFLVHPLPSVIFGADSVCVGLTTALTNDSVGGVWTSSNPSSGSIINPASGTVLGVSQGAPTITYTLPTSCMSIVTVTVNPLPGTIGGVTTVCSGLTTALNDTPPLGTWSTSDVTVDTVGLSSGVVTGVTTGIVPETALITYTLPTGCIAATSLNVNPRAAITGTAEICRYSSATLNNIVPGGSWSSSNGSIAEINSTSGQVYGVAAGTAVITYELPVTNCSSYYVVKVDSFTNITGALSVCQSDTVHMADSVSGGTWASSNSGVSTVDPLRGVVTGISAGVDTITYTLVTGCASYFTQTVNPLTPIFGNPYICEGGLTLLTDTTSGGGAWSMSVVYSSIAGVGSSGYVIGESAGTAVVTFTTVAGCVTYDTVTVNPLEDITGPLFVCVGDSTRLSDGATGGVWTISGSIATINSTTGAVTGISPGTASVTYSLGTGCVAPYVTVTVYAMPVAVSGPDSVCVGSIINLSDGLTGGTWVSGSTGIAVINSLSGSLFGSTSGTTIITYTTPGSCRAYDTITVNPLPSPISGPLGICLGLTNTLSDGGGGTWASGNIGVAPIDGSGNVTGATLGTSIITYTLITGCQATAEVTVNPLPLPIGGKDTVCSGQTITVTDGTPLGTWTSSNSAMVSVGSGTGVVTGVEAGFATITYTITHTGCIITETVVVDSLGPITGPASVCRLATVTVADNVTGGTWSSATTSTCTVDASGDVTGVTTGACIISYLLPTGCLSTKTITVNPIPSPPSGTAYTVCEGATITLTDASSGGSWISGSTGVATVTGGVSTTTTVGGIAAGTSVITYQLTTTGCFNTTTVSVYTLAPITGPDSVCAGGTLTLADTAGGGLGTWESGTTTVAYIGSTTGDVTTYIAGTSIITYTLLSGCHSNLTLTVNPLPFTIAGPNVVCENSRITLTDVTGTGTWSSSDGSVATITAGGVLTGHSGGTVTITYQLITGCYATTNVTVNPVPAAIGGPLELCEYSTVTLTDDTTLGVWSSNNIGVATIDPSSGSLYGAGGGTATITYTLATSCYATAQVTVDPVPPIIGPFNVCSGSQIPLTETIGGGTWTSGASGIASINPSTGVVSGTNLGVVAATATITYEFPSGCMAYAAVTVNPNPAPIDYTELVVCQGQSLTFTDATAGGNWTGSDGAVGNVTGVGTTGTLLGTGGGSMTITYTLPTSCYATVSAIIVNPITPITGGAAVCVGSQITVNDATAGGGWFSSNTTVATITGGGLISGLVAGTSTITWLITGTGCSATEILTVNPLPNDITGPTVVCAGSTIQLSGTPVAGGSTWTSSNGGVATVSGTGVVTGMGVVTSSTAIITYSLPTTCYKTYTVTVNPVPAAITGNAGLCVGTTTTVSDITPGGTWGSSNIVVATVTATVPPNATVNGLSVGTTTITYQLTSTGCYTTRTETVNSLPSAITAVPSFSVCVGSTTTLHDLTGGGTWTSGSIGVATVGSTTGIVTGVSAGTDIITYVLGTQCSATATVIVLPLPASLITPLSDTALCPGGFVELTASTGSSLTYQWYEGGGTISGATSATYIDSAAGTFTVFITSTATGCSLMSPIMHVSLNPVTAIVTALGSTTTCSGTGVPMIATPSGMDYQWVYDGVPIAGATAATYTATMTGSYYAVVTNTVGCSGTTGDISTVISLSPPGILTHGSLVFCHGGSVTFSGDDSSGYTYQWLNSSGPISGATTMTYIDSVSGAIELEETNGVGCTTVITATVTVVPLPLALVTASGPTTFCSGSSVTLDAPVGAGDTYQWYDDGIAISGATGRTYFTFTTGSYQVMVDSDGCTSMAAATNVAVVTTPALVPLTPSSFCWGGSSLLSAEVVGGATGVTYSWYHNDVLIPTATAATYIATIPGEYEVAVTVGSCFVQGDSVSVTEMPLPNPLITYSASIFRTQDTFLTYQWYNSLSGVPITGATADTLIATGNGTYKVSVTDSEGCTSFSDNYVLTDWTPNVSLGTNNPAPNQEIRIYPNPAQSTVHIAAMITVRAVITTVDGKTVIDQANATDINISNLADGMYMIMLYDANGTMVKTDKLLKATN